MAAQELQARQAAIRQALSQLDRQQQRLLDAYLAKVVGMPELERKRQELDRRRAALQAQQRQLDAAAEQRLELTAVTRSLRSRPAPSTGRSRSSQASRPGQGCHGLRNGRPSSAWPWCFTSTAMGGHWCADKYRMVH